MLRKKYFLLTSFNWSHFLVSNFKFQNLTFAHSEVTVIINYIKLTQFLCFYSLVQWSPFGVYEKYDLLIISETSFNNISLIFFERKKSWFFKSSNSCWLQITSCFLSYEKYYSVSNDIDSHFLTQSLSAMRAVLDRPCCLYQTQPHIHKITSDPLWLPELHNFM